MLDAAIFLNLFVLKYEYMASLADYLREHVSGEVLDSKPVLEHFSTDGSVLKMMPGIAVYPMNTQDIRKTVRFCFKLAEKGQVVPLTARGSGSDQCGGSLSDGGLILCVSPHLNKLISLDSGDGTVIVQPGINYRNLQDTLQTHGRYLPPYPSSIDYCTIGGAIANNASGERSFKYGPTRNYVAGLEIILSNGDSIVTGRLSKRELAKKKNQDNFEGKIYREMDELLTANKEMISTLEPETSKNSSGYCLGGVKLKDGSIDLTPLIVGSQGTLAVIAAATLTTDTYSPNASLVVGGFEDIEMLHQVVIELTRLKPATLEIVDRNLLLRVTEINPAQLKGIVEAPYPAFMLLVEFDDAKLKKQYSSAQKCEAIIKTYGQHIASSNDFDTREQLWKIRHSAALMLGKSAKQLSGDKKAALPIIEDGCVPIERFGEFISALYKLFKLYHLDIAIWGHAGDGNLHIQPKMDLASNFDRQKVVRLMDAYYKLVMALGGTISGEHNDGRLRTPYMHQMYAEEEVALFQTVKSVFDPLNFLNPGVKFGTSKRDLLFYMRHEFDTLSWQEHTPF
jgi:FAD/FMN-containing dehydrogenase